MAITGISYGKLVVKELDPQANEFSENLAYVKENLAGGGSAVNDVSSSVSAFVKDLVSLTDNTLKSVTVSYDVGIDIS